MSKDKPSRYPESLSFYIYFISGVVAIFGFFSIQLGYELISAEYVLGTTIFFLFFGWIADQ